MSKCASAIRVETKRTSVSWLENWRTPDTKSGWTDLHSGSREMARRIVRGIERAKVFMIVLSPQSVASENVDESRASPT